MFKSRIKKNVVFILLISLLIFFESCSIGNRYTGGGNGDECNEHLPCSDGFICSSNNICIPDPNHDIIFDSDEDVNDADISDEQDTSDTSDAGDTSDTDAGTCSSDEIECGDECCSDSELCLDDRCAPVSGACDSDEDCFGDTYCYEGNCIPYGFGPRTNYNPQCGFFSSAGLFRPVLQCQWNAPPAGDPYPNHVNVLSTPLVVDFDFDHDPEVIHPSIVFVSYDGDDGSSGYYNGAYGVIRVLDGETCEQIYNIGTQLNGCNTPAIADLNNDGMPEIIAHNGLGGIEAFTYDATSDSFIRLFHGHDGSGSNLTYGVQSTGWSSVAVHDLDDDGNPEILSYGFVYDHEGLQVSASLGFSGPRYPAAADLDRNGQVELSDGYHLWSYDAVSSLWTQIWDSGSVGPFTAYGDFGTFPENPDLDDRSLKDGIAEIVAVGSGRVAIINIYGRTVFGPYSFPAGSGGGPPTVGDFDGDGRAEFSAASSDSISVFDPDCLGIPDIETCVNLNTNGLLWTKVSQDHSSNQTGSSLFDFEGDGRVEVVYADEVFTRVYDGRTGEVVFSQWHSSCTWNENPIVADVDGDFNAELVVPSNLNCNITPTTAGGVAYPVSHNGNPMDPLFKGLYCEANEDCLSGICDHFYCRCTTDDECGGSGSGYVCDTPVSGTAGTGNVCRAEWLGAYPGIKVYADSLDRWVSSRTIWNQHTYSVSNIDDSGTVPGTSQWVQNWTDPQLNNFRQNVQGNVGSGTSPDLTVKNSSFDCGLTDNAEFLITVCNRGTQQAPSGILVSFYDQSSGSVICQTSLPAILSPGECVPISCSWDTPPRSISTSVDVLVRVDDNGSGTGEMFECIESNNSRLIPEIYCEVIGK